MNIDWLAIGTPIVQAVLVAAATVTAKIVYELGRKASEYLKMKMGSSRYDEAMKVAYGLYISLEDTYRDSLEKMGEVKKQKMKEMLLEQFPDLTEVQLESINKSVWLAFNESWTEEVNKDKLSNSEV